MSDWLNTLFPTGLAATLLAAYKGVDAIRKGAHKKERGAIADLKKWREEQYDARRQAEKERDAWRRHAGRCEYELDRRNIPVPKRPSLIDDGEPT